MMHFTREDWKAFSEGLVEEKRYIAMEEHLLICNTCVEIYLSFFPEENAAGFAKELSPQFTSNVMSRIGGLKPQGRRAKSRQGIISYYTAAACITLLLMSAGVFEGFAHMIPVITQAKIQAEHPLETDNGNLIEFGWSDRLLNNTLTFIDSIKPKGEEEVMY
jgi:hypothetical protein